MSVPRYRASVDANQREVVAALRIIGCSVWLIKEPCDLLVGFRGRWLVAEVKAPPGPKGGSSHQRLTEQQQELQDAKGRGPFFIFDHPSRAVDLVLEWARNA